VCNRVDVDMVKSNWVLIHTTTRSKDCAHVNYNPLILLNSNFASGVKLAHAQSTRLLQRCVDTCELNWSSVFTQSVQNAAERLIFGIRHSEHITHHGRDRQSSLHGFMFLSAFFLKSSYSLSSSERQCVCASVVLFYTRHWRSISIETAIIWATNR